jgi:hypothetical protein
MSLIKEKKEGRRKVVTFKTSALVYIPFAILIIGLLIALFFKLFGKFF